MGVFERENRKDKSEPVWRSSAGRMREAAPAPRKEGKDHLTGYEPREEERRARPREAARLTGTYGDVSVGVSKKREITLVVSKRRSSEGPAAARDEKAVRGESARRMNLARGRFWVNAHSGEKSAVAYRESHQKTPAFLLARFQEMMRTRRQDVLAEEVPFLDRRGETRELDLLARRAGALRAKGGAEARRELGKIERRRQTLTQRLTEKEAQERRLRLALQKAQDASRRRAGEVEQVAWSPPAPAAEGMEPPPDEEKNAPENRTLEEMAGELLARALGLEEGTGEANPDRKTE